jgi:UDP-N-acetylmuramoyl-L-alanyl-D-glutamate--2,6-diaminopimelate ligase
MMINQYNIEGRRCTGMNLKELVSGLDIRETNGNMDVEISDIVYDSRKTRKNNLFVCIDGTVSDGHKYVEGAVENGACALLVEKELKVRGNITTVRTGDTRYGLAYVSDRFFGHPSGKLNLIGITGTKGKTTTTYMVKSILEKAGRKTGLTGTVGNMIGSEKLYTERTTPESYDLQALFSEMLQKQVQNVVMEVSSQGIKLHRVAGCEFDTGIFTNISRAHIGPREHTDFQDYLDSKIKLFSMCKKGLVNIDSNHSDDVIKGARCEVLTFGIDNEADIKAYDIRKHPGSVEFKIRTPWGEEELCANIPGKFSIYNALAAAGACLMNGISFENIKQGLLNVSVPGRVEVVDIGRDYTVMIDYAHSPDSLENILNTVREFAPGRLICLFGCGGDRDRKMRPMMGEISGRLSDITIITSDNPRTEEPTRIINDIEEGIKKTGGEYIKITDRRDAIKFALSEAKPNDIIILAGKGHENYITFKDKTVHFDEREVVREIIEELEGKNNKCSV